MAVADTCKKGRSGRMRRSGFLGMLLLSMDLGAVALVSGPAQGSQASGGGTYFVEPGVRSEFQFNPSHVQCKIGKTVFPDGTALQMLMFSTSIDTVSIDSAA